MERTLAIIPIGAMPKNLCREVGTHLQETLGVPFELLISLGEPKYAFNAGNDQFHATAIVRRVGQAISPRKHLMGVGLCEVDLFMPDVNFVFGDSDREGKAAVVSLARLRPSWYGRPPDHSLLMRRLASEVLHEVGHVLGLPGCNHESCAMFISNTLSDTDRKEARLCDSCRSRAVVS
ncbi:MAG: archaemetzincin family Zn-dependent metalloprotease [Deltaproteobacteria bacterium]|nr:archaemetzincin family Zn-dependent metalloprotease [Deltaproteobacteria bacterium]